MDPSIISYQQAPAAAPPHETAGVVDTSSDTDNPTLNNTTEETPQSPQFDATQKLQEFTRAKIRYTTDDLKLLKASPQVKCPKLLIDPKQFIANDDQHSRTGNFKVGKWGEHSNSHHRTGNFRNNQRKTSNQNNPRDNKKMGRGNSNNNALESGGDFFELDSNQTPEWLEANPGETPEDTLEMGSTVEEFEAWKAKKKLEDMRNAGLEMPDDKKSDLPAAAPLPQQANADRMFGMWGASTSASRLDGVDLASVPKSGKASKFSRFFNTESPQTPPATVATPPPEAEKRPDDKQGFDRIMEMLNSSGEVKPESATQSPAETNQQVQPPQPKNDGSNDLFFQSLLNKSSQSQSDSKEATPSGQSPVSLKSEPEKSRTPKQQPSKPQTPKNPAAQQSSSPQQHQQQQPPPQPQPPHQQPQQQGVPPPHMQGFPPPPPGMYPMPPPGMFENLPPPPPGMMFPPPPPQFQQDGGNNGHQNFPPPPPSFPPPFFGNFPPPPPQNGMPPMPPPPPPHLQDQYVHDKNGPRKPS